MKNIIITGATGMIGNLILENCLSSSQVNQVNVFLRKKIDQKYKKLKTNHNRRF